MTGERGGPPEQVLWRARVAAGGRQRELRCTIERLADDCYELRVSFGGNPLVTETFTNREDPLAKAEELRLALAPGRGSRRGARGGRPATRH
jgi:hypothetical protein